MTNYGRVIVFFCQANCRQRFRERPNLIHFDQNRIRHVLGDSPAEKFYVRDKDIVTYQLNLLAELFRQLFPTDPIIFGTAIFDRNDRKPRTKISIVPNQLLGGLP